MDTDTSDFFTLKYVPFQRMLAGALALLVQRLLQVPVTGPRFLVTRTVDSFTGPEGSHPWPSSVCWLEPEAAAGSQNRIVLSKKSPLPDARSRPSGEKATDQMMPLQKRSKSWYSLSLLYK
jgi:hypothetical protein